MNSRADLSCPFRFVLPAVLLLLVAMPFFGWVLADEAEGGVEGAWVVEAEIERDVDGPDGDDPQPFLVEWPRPLPALRLALAVAVDSSSPRPVSALSLPAVRAPPGAPLV